MKIITGGMLFLIAHFIFGYSTYYTFISWYYAGQNITSSSEGFVITANLVNALLFTVSAVALLLNSLRYVKNIKIFRAYMLGLIMFIENIALFSISVGVHKLLTSPALQIATNVEITNHYFYPELIISTLATLFTFGIFHAKALSKHP